MTRVQLPARAIMKKSNLIGCCGISCGLCPKFQSKSRSKCFGCGFNAHCNYCSIFNCCTKKHKYTTCADCLDFPCKKFDKWSNPNYFVGYGSWFTYADNIEKMRNIGIKKFIEEEKKRKKILETLIEKYNPYGLINFYCKAATLLNISSLKNALKEIKKIKERKRKAYKEFFLEIAKKEGISI